LIRKVTPSGIILPVAVADVVVTPRRPHQPFLLAPTDVTFDGAGNMLIAERLEAALASVVKAPTFQVSRTHLHLPRRPDQVHSIKAQSRWLYSSLATMFLCLFESRLTYRLLRTMPITLPNYSGSI